MRNRVLVLVFLGIFVSLAWGDTAKGEGDFHSLVIKLYSFSPSKLNKEDMQLRSKELDSFWGKVSSDRARLLPNLRQELGEISNPPFFYYDGAKLLLSLSNDKADKQIAVAAIARSDLSDIEPTDYIRTTMRLGADGIDTSSAAFRVLDYPKFKVFVPTHSLTLDQDYSLIFMLYQLHEDVIVEKVINRLRKEKDLTATKSLLRVLWYAATPVADEAIARVAKDSVASDDVRQFSANLSKETEEIAALPLFKIEKLRKQLAFSKALRKAAPIFSSNQKGKSMSKEEIEVFKLFLEALRDSEEEMGKTILKDIAQNRDGTVPNDVSNYAKSLLKGDGKLSPSVHRTLPQDDVADLKKLRQTILSGLNDEVLYDFNAIAVLIRWSQAKTAAQKDGQETDQPVVPPDRSRSR